MIYRDHSSDSVFFAELDDDYQELVGLTYSELQSRLSCYYLIAPRIILHPAYVWQSPASHKLLGAAGKELLRPPFTDLELGLHDSIGSYMEQRISQLQSHQELVTRELTSYQDHGDSLRSEARDLNLRFGPARRRDVADSRRDHFFRELVRADLDELHLDTASLAAHLRTVSIAPTGVLEEPPLGAHLKSFLGTSSLVSVDTFLNEISSRGAHELAQNPRVRRRLLALYYRTYSDRDTMIPGTRKLLPGSVVNHYDSEVFWQSTAIIFGDGFARLASANTPDALRALRDIRESSDWTLFQGVYFRTLDEVDDALRTQPDAHIAELAKLHPGSSRTYVLRELWERRKLTLSGAALAGLSTAGVAFQTPIGAVTSVAGLAGTVLTVKALRDAVKRFVDEYNSLDLVKVQETVHFHVSRAITRISDQEELD